ncbi:C-methyltransferase C-terminal domain protein [Leptospira interrogans str. 2003000735]|uniref:methyltransferase domain-containing protein n=1 Tax=Leptospira interrogans TaxID=173 RepID=UPI0002921148|nr:methyltransferase domain-containing protein [Leptospira interrogans]AKH77641.1 SAM-dependent methyltransferase [Leptospira interrogans serovar Bratislava]EKN90309.1 C-methyltransferase C-terminal domain protein [Leptospira interrogans str. 2002000624]EKQ36014.1 C-methyltransferase C-terminal domain protein [Leptospira interrogans str. 2002000621]EKQ49983.1 C-methyltransferase C-terminal domain protein [Leptospira interrogans str. 2002000623]EMJ68804.1 C-methyltransferase C-terminal domain p
MNIYQFNNLETSGELLIDFGLQPVSNRFSPSDSLSKVPNFPLKLKLVKDSGLIHLAEPFPKEEIKPQYDWLTCFEPEAHLDNMVNTIINLSGINKNSKFGAYSFKDDSTLTRLNNKGYQNTWRIDPESDLDIYDKCANVETYQFAFNVSKTDVIKEKYGLSDVFIVRHVIEHSYKLSEFLDAAKNLIHENGYIVWELPDCERALEKGDWTTIWEEHVFYFTSFTFKNLLLSSGFEIVHFESVPYLLENSLVAIVKLAKQSITPIIDSNKLNQEIERAYNFVESVQWRKKIIREKLEKIKKEKGLIAMFGAGHLSVAFLSIAGITDLIDYVIDDNPNKKGLYMPIGNLEIVGSDVLYSKNIKFCLLSLNPQNQPRVVENHKKFVDDGGIFVSIFPGGDKDFLIP